METEPQKTTEAHASGIETAAPEAPVEKKYDVVVCAYPGTETLMTRLWDRFHEGRHLVVTDTGAQLPEILAECLADNRIADQFTILPANIIPCTEITDELLKGNYVYVTRNGERQAASRVPMTFDKERLVVWLAADDSETDTAEAFLKRYNAGKLLMEVSFSFGNFITPVLRANPCENVVIEAFLRKFFVAASPEGFAAIAALAEKFLLKEEMNEGC